MTMDSTLPFISRRSVIHGIHGMVSSSQPLATQAGVEILRRGGNAADAAVAVAAVLGVTEPGSTGVGGDASCLFYDSNIRRVRGLNGSGRTPAALTVEYLSQKNLFHGPSLSSYSVHSITVPGAVAAWIDTLEHFGSGKLNLETILRPAIDLAENGYPVSLISSSIWKNGEKMLMEVNNQQNNLLIDGVRHPNEGDVIQLLDLAETLKTIARYGKDGFYKGRIADAIIDSIKNRGGLMTHNDLASHESELVDPISFEYHDWTLWEMPPNSQGITALLALGIISELEKDHGLDISKLEHNSAEYLHIIIEVLRLGFADTRYYVTDPQVLPIPTEKLLSKEYFSERAKLIDFKKRNNNIEKGYPDRTSDTVYFSVVDNQGNACSFMGSNCVPFGTHIIPDNCGFPLHCRGRNFVLKDGHPNCIGPNKRPYHTMIPSMITSRTVQGNHDLEACFGVMGSFMQPQGHVQVIMNLMNYLANPQHALDLPRICISPPPLSSINTDNNHPSDGLPANIVGFTNMNNCIVNIEDGIAPTVVQKLEAMGHTCTVIEGYGRSIFGRGQIIRVVKKNNRHHSVGRYVLAAGSDPRGDGQASPLTIFGKL
ncbi:gamma-glutamyltranspeptidase [Phascolomyces articulosus]|uniref:Gamma-glutamyltranspeptidase n=1 Tax=Phascolomyces articulosus TaxID=60185 RepID=A0AAD5K0F0_9FUNG|nr:gamma-glutamyltranspeptidase [Phascolomyces articulosus]